MKKVQQGFTLIELMITIAIIGILAAIALPAYKTYTDKAKFSEVILSTGVFKTAAETAWQKYALTNISKLDAATRGIPANVGNSPGDHAGAVSISNGIITAKGVGGNLNNITYTLTAAADQGGLKWTESGTCVAKGLC